MKSVGEVMAIGRTFQESLHKALRGLETGLDGLDPILTLPLSEESEKNSSMNYARPGGSAAVCGDAFRAGWSLERVAELTAIDPWFLAQIAD